MLIGHALGCTGKDPCTCAEFRCYRGVCYLNAGTCAMEVAGSVLSGSLALLSDAFHVAIDMSGALVAMLIEHLTRNAPQREDEIRGWGGFVSNGLLCLVVMMIFAGAWHRFHHPEPVLPMRLFLFATAGLFLNAWALVKVHQSEARNITRASLLLHVALDSCMSLVVIAVAGVLGFYPAFLWIDPAASCIIAIVITAQAIKNLRVSIELIDPPPRWKSC